MENNSIFDMLVDYAAKAYPDIQMKLCCPQDIIFEERVKLSCFYCARYNSSWRCPPRIPQLDYRRVFCEFEHAAFVWLDIPFTDENYSEVRSESTNRVHHAILDLEKVLLEQHVPIYLSFIGGSCKLCKNGCGKEKCNNPYMARIPLEALGVNVVKSAARCGIGIQFPVVSHMMRLGLILW